MLRRSFVSLPDKEAEPQKGISALEAVFSFFPPLPILKITKYNTKEDGGKKSEGQTKKRERGNNMVYTDFFFPLQSDPEETEEKERDKRKLLSQTAKGEEKSLSDARKESKKEKKLHSLFLHNLSSLFSYNSFTSCVPLF